MGELVKSLLKINNISNELEKIAEMAGNTITLKFAVITFLLVSATNLASKVAYSFFQGNRKFAVKFFTSMVVITVVSFVGLIFVK